MRASSLVGTFAASLALLAGAAPRAAEDHAARAAGQARPQGEAQARLARLKGLAGTWTGKATHASGQTTDATVVWSVTGGGTAVVETLFPGTAHEMMTVYTVDGDELVLTHYCAAGNQPVMRARRGGGPDVIAFDFAGGGNLTPTDPHMHSAALTFVSADALRTEWGSWRGGKPEGAARFELARKR